MVLISPILLATQPAARLLTPAMMLAACSMAALEVISTIQSAGFNWSPCSLISLVRQRLIHTTIPAIVRTRHYLNNQQERELISATLQQLVTSNQL
jgi:hypothetical protein